MKNNDKKCRVKKLLQLFRNDKPDIIAFRLTVGIKWLADTKKHAIKKCEIERLLNRLIGLGCPITKPQIYNMLDNTTPTTGYLSEASLGEVLGIKKILTPSVLDLDTELMSSEYVYRLVDVLEGMRERRSGVEQSDKGDQ